MVLTMVNNLFVVIFRKDSAQAHETWKHYLFLQLLKLISALIPLLVAMAVSNLVEVLKFAGLVSLILTFIFPAILQLTSQWICKKTFAKAIDPSQEMQDDSVPNGSCDSTGEMSPLVPPPEKNPSLLYMTPYSNIFSYWPAVIIIGLVGVALLLLAIIGIMPAAYF